MDLDEEQSIAVVQAVVQPTQLEVVVTDEQCIMTFNNEANAYVCKQASNGHIPKYKLKSVKQSVKPL